ncbi:hypothetical protein BSKO_07740 [Bryopsis sp. KO-2023]|nr:hypothetical protein BSKO_07740 [Bryopsis sp. KO-2023]
MGRQEGCPRYMQATESSRLRGSGKPGKKDVKSGPRRPATKPRGANKTLVAGTRPVKSTVTRCGEVEKSVSGKDAGRKALALALGRTSIPKAPAKTLVDSRKPALSVSNRSQRPSPSASPKKLSPVSSLKRAAARVIPAKMRAARMDVSKKAVERIRNTFASKLPAFSKSASCQKSKMKAATFRPAPMASKIPRAPACGMRELTSNPGVEKSRVMTRAERLHHKVWEGMTKTNQQAFGFGGIPNLAAVRC